MPKQKPPLPATHPRSPPIAHPHHTTQKHTPPLRRQIFSPHPRPLPTHPPTHLSRPPPPTPHTPKTTPKPPGPRHRPFLLR